MKKYFYLLAIFLWSFSNLNAQTYCTPAFASGCNSGDLIDSFTIPLAGFSHLNTGCSPGAYGDYTATHIINMSPAIPYPYSVTHNFTSQNVRIWIDFNNDGTFTDAAPELVSTASSTGTGAASVTNGTINIPVTVTPGTYRMRVADRFSSQPIPCNTAGFGEAHDYTVIIGPPPTCLFPTNTNVNTVAATSATLTWTASTSNPANGYQYYLSTTNTPPTAATAPTGTSATTTAPLTTLTPSTTYYWWVRAVCSASDQSMWMAGPSFTTSQIPATMPYVQPFTGPNDFGFINGTQPNKWAYGSATGNPANSIYISDNDGLTNTYSGTTSVVQAYRDIAVPAGTNLATLMFDWKAVGESTFDYFRVWLVPTTFTPTAGTQITATTGRTQIGSNFNQQASWQTYINQSVNLTPYAGGIVRLVFEWRNDTSVFNDPPAAIDNINFLVPTCLAPSTSAPTAITANSVSLPWSGPSPAPANGFQYYISTSNVPPTAATAPSGTSPSSPAAVSGLTPNTTYYWWVRAACSTTNRSIWMPGPSFTTGQIPAPVPYHQSFTGPNDFTFVGNQVNKWAYGAAEGNPPNSIYISNDDGVSNAYTITSTSFAHAYRDIVIPAGSTLGSLMFDWKSEGQSGQDYFKVWMVPVSHTIVPGAALTAGGGKIQIGGNFQLEDTWQTYLNTNVPVFSFIPLGGVMRLVFEWRNNATTGTQPPAAIDNINFSVNACRVPPSNLASSNITSTSATLSWTAAVPAPAQGYHYYLSPSNIPPTPTTAPTGSATGSPQNVTGLTPNTTYYWWVRSNCGPGDTSFWVSGGYFTTAQIPATIPYIQNFTGPNDFGFVNGSQPNKWAYGSATGNPANAIYISNNNGAANEYTITAPSVVQAYRDIIIPPGTTTVTFKFDWKSDGENNNDYMRVWLVPTSYMPVAGTQTAADPGRIPIAGNFQLQNTWQTYEDPALDVSSFANGIMRVVFEWRNNASAGTNPPAAVDNVMIVICDNSAPLPVASAITHNTATITWPQDIGGASYVVRYRPVGTTGWVSVIPVPAAPWPATTNSIDLSNLISSQLYEVEVAAVCQGVEGTYAHIEFTTECNPVPPSGLTVNNITSSSALVTWDPMIPFTYTLEYREVGGTTWTVVNVNTNSYTISGLLPYTNYEVRIASACSITYNIYTTPKVFTTLSTCEMAPVGLSITNLTMTQAQVNWNAVPGATYIVRWRKVGSSAGWTSAPVSVNNYIITGLTEETQYEVQIANVCNGGTQIFTDPYVFTTPGLNYCGMGSTDSSAEHISNVNVKPFGNAEMNSNSGASNYTSYVGDITRSIVLLQGSNNNQISITKSWNGTPRNAAVTVWIDFNRDGLFTNDERILMTPPNTEANVSGTFSVPASAYASLTLDKFVVMRVAMSRTSSPEMCSVFEFGEVEDYNVRIVKPLATNILDLTQIQIYPNPVKNVLNITRVEDGSKYTIYSAIGQLVQSGGIFSNKIDVSRLINGIFIINIEAKNGQSAQRKFIKE